MRRTLTTVLLLALVSGCQLVDSTDDIQPDPTSDAAAAEALLGSPEEDFPSTLDELEAFARPEALTWQDQPVLADLTVWLDPQQTWERVRLTYVAGNADRLLTVRADRDRLRLERPRLEGLQLLPVPPEALTELPALPDDVLEPAALADAAANALAECDGGGQPVRAVLYATGAPAAWDGEQWSTTPNWRATVVTRTTGVSVDPRSGAAYAPLTCVESLLLDSQ